MSKLRTGDKYLGGPPTDRCVTASEASKAFESLIGQALSAANFLRNLRIDRKCNGGGLEAIL